MRSLQVFPVSVIVAIIGLSLFFEADVLAEVTLAGGKNLAGEEKKYGGVFVAGAAIEEGFLARLHARAVFYDNVLVYTKRLLAIKKGGWESERMKRFKFGATLAEVEGAINSLKPVLESGDEFQFFYAGHGTPPTFQDGPDEDTEPDTLDMPTLAKWLSGFNHCVTISVIFASCHSWLDAINLANIPVTDIKGERLGPTHLGIAYAATGVNYMSLYKPILWEITFVGQLSNTIRHLVDVTGVAIMKFSINNYVKPNLVEAQTGDNDGDGKIDEDGACFSTDPTHRLNNVPDCDDDQDGDIDEDPSPQESGYIEGGIPSPTRVDPNITVIYEPEDPEEYGPPVPVGAHFQGDFDVSLGWRPGEDLGYPPFTITVIIDPNVDGIHPHEDFVLPAGTEPNGIVTLTFDETNWNVPQTVIVKAVKDLDKEGNEAYEISLTSSIDIDDPNFGSCEPVERTLAIAVIDNDIPQIILSKNLISLSENDPCTTKCLNVRLSHQPSSASPVNVLVAIEGDAVEAGMFEISPPLTVASEPNHLTFTPTTAGTAGQPETWTPGNCADWDPCNLTSCWNVAQTICVNAVDNEDHGSGQ